MNQAQQHRHVAGMFMALGVNLNALLAGAKSPHDALAIFDRAKESAKRNYRKLAFKLHPDRGGDETEFKKLNALWSTLEKVRPVLRSPQPVAQVIIVGPSPFHSSDTTTSTTYTTYGSSVTGTGGF